MWYESIVVVAAGILVADLIKLLLGFALSQFADKETQDCIGFGMPPSDYDDY
jgi:hypothetical protein